MSVIIVTSLANDVMMCIVLVCDKTSGFIAVVLFYVFFKPSINLNS